MTESNPLILDPLDRRIIKATQAGLPLVPQPYRQIADRLEVSVEELMSRLRNMLECGVIRRIGAIPNHYTLGFHANGMSVWDVCDEKVSDYGRKVGALEFVSHAYHRPRHLPEWRYNLFAMVHGRSRDEVMQKVAVIAELLGQDCCSQGVLFSTRILKKTGLRI